MAWIRKAQLPLLRPKLAWRIPTGSFTNAARADGVACDMAKMNGVAFTQADIGKTFAYEVREVVPAEANAKPGVSYDKSVHTLEITVGMSGDADKRLTLTTKLGWGGC